jgi:hypothetical protein
LLLEKERVDLTSHNLNAVNKVGLLIKTMRATVLLTFTTRRSPQGR